MAAHRPPQQRRGARAGLASRPNVAAASAAPNLLPLVLGTVMMVALLPAKAAAQVVSAGTLTKLVSCVYM